MHRLDAIKNTNGQTALELLPFLIYSGIHGFDDV